ncbi:MAG: hypothetical protein KF832_12430 [Caldilineaceae bacterium]|nr:hypothetical protein [Caldilineaceae bacterium]
MRIRTILFGLTFLVMVGLRWPSLTAYAQRNDPIGDTVPPGGTITGTVSLYLPFIMAPLESTPAPTPIPTPTVVFTALPVAGAPIDRPPATHPDLNLALRSYITTTTALGLINVGGDTDPDAPQLAGLFAAARLPVFVAAHQVHDWHWGCSAEGCRGEPIGNPSVTLLSLAVTPGEPLFIPTRNPQIYTGGYKVLVLYAEETRITLTYTREDTAARGYLVHLEDLQVDPALVALYREKDAAGRRELPALRNAERFANASGTSVKVAIRDTGSFMDPRSRKDWWVGY